MTSVDERARERLIAAGVRAAVDAHFQTLHEAGLCGPVETIGPESRQVVGEQVRPTVIAAVDAWVRPAEQVRIPPSVGLTVERVQLTAAAIERARRLGHVDEVRERELVTELRYVTLEAIAMGALPDPVSAQRAGLAALSVGGR